MDTTTALARFGLEREALDATLGALFERRIDDADVYMEHVESEGLVIDEGLVKKGSRSIHQGFGVRAG